MTGRMAARRLLEHMFDVEMSFISSGSKDVSVLAEAFHPDVVVHEPSSLPYSGDWSGLSGVGTLFHKMREVWSDMGVEGITAAQDGDAVFMACTLNLTCRGSEVTIKQPFAQALQFRDSRLLEATPFYYDTHEIVQALANGT